VVAEVFLVMVESIPDLRTAHEAGLYAWLIQIALGKISRALRHLSHHERRQIPLATELERRDHDAGTEPLATDLLSNPAALHEWHETLDALKWTLGSLSSELSLLSKIAVKISHCRDGTFLSSRPVVMLVASYP
jgi:DNA-directed RNA polymerase specialized sigma24 family protein